MLIVISDLHFLDETAGQHNTSSAAFEHVFFPHLLSLIRAKGVQEIKLLLLGDVFEFIRTEHWLETPPDDRPWGTNGVADVESPREAGATERWCLRIIGRMPADGLKSSVPEDTILSRNWESLRFIREFAPRLHEALGHEIPVKTIYMAGNHDRLCNIYPRLRDEVRDILGVTIDRDTIDGDPAGEWWYKTEYLDEEYGVFARHGQEFDLWSYGGGDDFTRRGHLQVPIGDLLGVEFATKIPYRLSLYRGESSAVTDQLVEFMKEMGLVRPFNNAMQWLYFAMKNQDNSDVRAILDRIFEETVGEILDMKFVQTWRVPNTHLDNVMRLASNPWLRWIRNALLANLSAEKILPFFSRVGHKASDPEQDIHLIGAYNEKKWRENDRVQFILYGHTHMPMQRPLDAEHGHEVLYINTGTWRDSIFRTTSHDIDPDFMKLTQITYTAFYRADENVEEKGRDAVSFETLERDEESDAKEAMIIKGYRDAELFSEHVIEIVPGDRSMEIREIRNYLHQPNASATCLFEIHPQSYSKIDIQMRRGELRASVMVDVSADGTVAITHNGEHLEPIQHGSSELLLFDGPTLMFDWVNAVMMLGICDGETIRVPVNVIDIRTGELIPTFYTFRRTDNLVTIGKGIDPLADSEIILHREDFGIDRYHADGCRYQFPKIEGSADEE